MNTVMYNFFYFYVSFKMKLTITKFYFVFNLLLYKAVITTKKFTFFQELLFQVFLLFCGEKWEKYRIGNITVQSIPLLLLLQLVDFVLFVIVFSIMSFIIIIINNHD